MKFSEYAYKRPVFEDVKEQQLKLIAELGYAKSFEQAEKAFLDSEKLNRSVQTMGTLASIRFTLNTADEFYKAEQDYWDETGPLLAELEVKMRAAMLASPFKADFEKKYGEMLIKNAELSVKSMTPELAADAGRKQAEQRIQRPYIKHERNVPGRGMQQLRPAQIHGKQR